MSCLHVRCLDHVLCPKAPASHQLLSRMYHSIAGEYDVVKQTPAHSRTDVNASHIQVNEFRFKAKDMVRSMLPPLSGSLSKQCSTAVGHRTHTFTQRTVRWVIY